MNRCLSILLILLCPITGHSQTTADQNRARATYLQAEQAFENQQFEEALRYLSRTEELFGGSNARIESLRVRVLYKAGEYDSAREAVGRFFTMEATPELALEMSQLEETILRELAAEKEAEAEARRKAAERLARSEAEKAAEAARLEAERAARVERAKLGADEILDRHLSAVDMGGARTSVRTMRESLFQGINGGPKNTRVVRYSKHPDSFRADSDATFESISVSVSVACVAEKCRVKSDPANSWKPMDRTEMGRDGIGFQLAPLASLLDEGHSVEYGGEVEWDGEPFFLFSAVNTAESVSESRFYLDVETFLLHRLQMDYNENATHGAVASEYLFSDYREVGGLSYPFERSLRTHGAVDGFEYDATLEYQTDQLQLNPALDQSLFAPASGS